jgi:hypothetical protein
MISAGQRPWAGSVGVAWMNAALPWMNTGKQPDDDVANPGKSLRGAQSEHTACGQLWGKVRGNRRTTRHARGRTEEQRPHRVRPLTAKQHRPGRHAHLLWTHEPTLAWADGSCPHRPPCLLRLRSLLTQKTKQPTVGAKRGRPATPCPGPAGPLRRPGHGIMGSSAIHVPRATIPTHHHHMTCSGQEAARREIPG